MDSSCCIWFSGVVTFFAESNIRYGEQILAAVGLLSSPFLEKRVPRPKEITRIWGGANGEKILFELSHCAQEVERRLCGENGGRPENVTYRYISISLYLTLPHHHTKISKRCKRGTAKYKVAGLHSDYLLKVAWNGAEGLLFSELHLSYLQSEIFFLYYLTRKSIKAFRESQGLDFTQQSCMMPEWPSDLWISIVIWTPPYCWIWKLALAPSGAGLGSRH